VKYKYINEVVVSSWKDGREDIERRDLFNNFRIEKFDSNPDSEIKARMVGHFLNPEHKPTLEKILKGNETFAQNLSLADKSKLLDIASEPEDLQRVKSLANFVMDKIILKILREKIGEEVREEKEVDVSALQKAQADPQIREPAKEALRGIDPVPAEGDLGEPAKFPKTEPSDDISLLDTTQLEQLLRSPDILEEINSAIDHGDMAKFKSLIEGNEMFIKTSLIKASLTKEMENGYKIDQILIQLLGNPKYQDFSIQTLRLLYQLGNKEEVFSALQKAQADPQPQIREHAKKALSLISPDPVGVDLVGNAEFVEKSTQYDPEYYVTSQKTEPLTDDIPMLDTTQLEQLLRNPDSAPLTLNSLLQVGVRAMPAMCVILTQKGV